MVNIIGVQNRITTGYKPGAFGKKEVQEETAFGHPDYLMAAERKNHPVSTAVKIEADKLKKAFTTYPQKGFRGSKNANFYEFLTMGTVPYLLGSATMMAVFNLARVFFDTPASKSAGKLGNKMALGVVMYGLLKNFSKKFIELPVKWTRGIDMNLPYKKKINELPEKGNEDNLEKYEYHKAFESVDFPRWDLFYDNKFYGEERGSYYNKISQKFGYNPNDVDYSDQKIKKSMKETIVKTRFFTTITSYLWAGLGVGLSMQTPWENMVFSPVQRVKNLKNHIQQVKIAAEKGNSNVQKYSPFIKDFAVNLGRSFEKFIGVDFSKIVNNVKAGNKITNGLEKASKSQIAGRVFLGTAIGMTILGNFLSIHDFNKDKGSKTHASTSLIDERREKVVC